MTTGGAFQPSRENFGTFGDEFGGGRLGGGSQYLHSDAGSNFGNDDVISSHYQPISEYGGLSQVGGNDDAPKPATGGSRRKQVLER